MGTAILIRGLAVLMAACGILLLQAAWRARSGNGLRLAAGWAGIVLSVLAWASTGHPDKGSAYGILVLVILSLAALGWSYMKGERRPPRPGPERPAAPDRPHLSDIVQRILAACLIGPLAGLSALALATAGFAGLRACGVEHTANLVIAMFAFPLLWAGLAVTTGASRRFWQKGAIVLCAGLVPLTYLTIAS